MFTINIRSHLLMSNTTIDIEEDEELLKNDKPSHITEPFNPANIRITNTQILLPSLITRLKNSEIDLTPDFQRNPDLWNNINKSKLIESILLKLPLPIFYFDVANPAKWVVVDGLQRTSAIKSFFLDNMHLQNLEFLDELNGQTYSDLDRQFHRTIDDTILLTYQIESPTPKRVKYSIFNRINTLGLKLTPQEIRQVLNQEGEGVEFLNDIVKTKAFNDIVGITSKRKMDNELVLRFIAFTLEPKQKTDFSYRTMGDFLDTTMEKIDDTKTNKPSLPELKEQFIQTLIFSEQLLGKGHRFSRSIGTAMGSTTLNKSLFDVLTV